MELVGAVVEGARLRIRERIGGIPGEATGVITRFDPGEAVTWQARARYRWFGLPVVMPVSTSHTQCVLSRWCRSLPQPKYA